MLGPVVVNVAPLPENAEHTEAMVEACSRAIPDAECVLGTAEDAARPRATVVFETDLRVRLEIWLPDEPEGRSRVLAFRAEDEPIERWRAVGLVLGVLAGGRSDAPLATGVPGAAGPPPADARELPDGSARAGEDDRLDRAEPELPGVSRSVRPRATPEPQPAESPRVADGASRRDAGTETAGAPIAKPTAVHPGWIALFGRSSPGFDAGPWRVGGGIEAALKLGDPFVRVAADYAVTARSHQGLAASWTTVGIGAGWSVVGASWLTLEPRVDILGQRLFVSTADGATAETDEGARLLMGGRAAVTLVFGVARHVGLVAGGDVRSLSAPTDVTVRGRVVATESPVRLSGFVGVRYGSWGVAR